MQPGQIARGGREPLRGAGHGRHRCRGVRVGARTDRGQHGRPQQHRLGRVGTRDLQPGAVGKHLAGQRGLRRAAAGDDRVDLQAFRRKAVQQLPQPVADAGQPAQIQLRQVVDPAIQTQARDDRPRFGIGKGRPVAQEFGHDQHPGRGPDRLRQVGGQRRRMGRDMVDQRETLRLCPALDLGRVAVQVDQMRQRRPCGRLPALVQPQARQHRVIIRTPDPRDRRRPDRRGHRTGRGSEHIGQPPRRVGIIAGQRDAQRAQPPGMGVDQPRRHGNAFRQAQIACGHRVQRPQRGAGADNLGPDPAKALVRQAAQADGAEVARVPAVLMRQIGPFAGDRAG